MAGELRRVMREGVYLNGTVFNSPALATHVGELVLVDDFGISDGDEVEVRTEGGRVICSADKVGKSPFQPRVIGTTERELRRRGVLSIGVIEEAINERTLRREKEVERRVVCLSDM